MSEESLNPLQLRELILNTRKPLVLRQLQTDWNCFGPNLTEWCAKFDAATAKESIVFERMPHRQGDTPQWERQRELVRDVSMQQFLLLQSGKKAERPYWTALNYKRATEVPQVCRADVDFGRFGFPHVTEDATYWLSSSGANTPCHYDTYGCNVVMQVYGSKSWLLFPPNTPLSSTRIPYEESSVYCLENFYAPSATQLPQLLTLHSAAYNCVLQPQDVLIVPRRWWHYVETRELSLSVNAWIPLQLDVEAQLEECIVKFLMESFAKGVDEKALKYLLNPNQLSQIAEEPQLLAVCQHLLKTAVSEDPLEKQMEGSAAKQTVPPTCAYQYLTEAQLAVLMRNFPCANEVTPMTQSAFKELLLKNGKRFDASNLESGPAPLDSVKEILLQSICSPKVIKAIKNELVTRYRAKQCFV